MPPEITPPVAAPAALTFDYYVVGQPVLEGEKHYLKNQKIKLTADRAKALGEMVAPWDGTFFVHADELTEAGAEYKKGDTIVLGHDRVLNLGNRVGVEVPVIEAKLEGGLPNDKGVQVSAQGADAPAKSNITPTPAVTAPAASQASKPAVAVAAVNPDAKK